MANNYVQMSEQYDLNPEQVKWFQDFLARCLEYDDLDDSNENNADKRTYMENLFGELDDNVEDYIEETLGLFELNVKDSTVWVCDPDGEYVNVNLVCCVLQAMLKETHDTDVCTGTMSETCSKPRVGEFGGGWFCVSATEIRMGNSWDAAAKAAEEMKQ